MIIERTLICGSPNGRYLGTAIITLADGAMRFCVRGIRILDIGQLDPILSMPTFGKMENGRPTAHEIFYPMNSEARAFLESEIIRTFKCKKL